MLAKNCFLPRLLLLWLLCLINICLELSYSSNKDDPSFPLKIFTDFLIFY
jgi:hypothetical protein